MAAVPQLTLPRHSLYPERPDRPSNWERKATGALLCFGKGLTLPLRQARVRRFVSQVNAQSETLAGMGEPVLRGFVDDVRRQLIRDGFRHETVASCFAAIREVSRRNTGLFHHDVQIKGGYALLKGMIAELETGEGKTLTATLAAATAAVARIPVHVVTVNDYLAQRDKTLMAPIYQALGLRVAVVVGGMGHEERREAYGADIVYCTNKEAAFDYLRDRIALGFRNSNLRSKLARLHEKAEPASQPVMRGLHFAIVDEADSVLIDEARTPLIISGKSDPESERRRAEEALRIVAPFDLGREFTIRRDKRQIELTEDGEVALSEAGEALGGPWRGSLYREEMARNALAALHLFHRDEHYLVRDDKIAIIDEYTGRVMPDRAWGEGLHQMIESKEGCTVTGQSVPLARMTYQRFFRRYRRLAGMTGTAREAQRELWTVYRLPVASIETHRPMQRVYAPVRIFESMDEKWRHIVARTEALSECGVPVLIGTRSVAASEEASRTLEDAGVAHRVLNAAQDAHEAEIIAEAGQPGRVTVATNMAGRGVDIRLGEGIAERGGLHIIMSERHDSARIDRQLFGRCGRQGEPGHIEVVLSLEDPLITESGMRLSGTPLAPWLGKQIFNNAQQTMERRYARMRRELLAWDERLGITLAFTGRSE